MSDKTFNQDYWDNQTIKHKEYLNKWVDRHNLRGSSKFVFISPGFGFSNAFYSCLEYAFDDFIKELSISSYPAMIDLYGDWIVYRKVDSSTLKAIGRIKDIFGW